MREKMRYENPPNMVIVNVFKIIFIILLIFGIFCIIFKKGPLDGWAVFIIMNVGCFFLVFAMWYRQYYTRPKIVEINDGGLVLHTIYSKDINLSWDDVQGYWANSEETDAAKKTAGSGTIIPIKGPFYATNYYIAITVASEYHRITGKVLPSANTNEWEWEFRKRIKGGRIN
jgi:hypothetical protein